MIDFQNLPNTTTPLNRTNLNQMQEFSFRGEATTNLNEARTTGLYKLNKAYTNSPKNEVLYGILVIYESNGKTWQPSGTSGGNSWIWQEIRLTNGEIYVRNAVNTTSSWTEWQKVVKEQTSTWQSVSVNSEYFNGGSIKYKKIGDMVFVSVSGLTLKKDITDSDDNYTVIASGLPNSISQDTAVLSRFSDNKIMRIDITTDGKIRFHWTGSITSSTQSFEGHFFYITNS